MKKNGNRFRICGYSLLKLGAYFTIYSVAGFIIETIFGIITKGQLESRQSYLYGPFCGIYGIGAVTMILCLKSFKKNANSLFWGGYIVGSVIEYVLSLIGELVFKVKWWDYSHMPLNLNGRICLFYSVFWGFLAIYFMTYIHPKVDKFFEFLKTKFSIRLLKGITAFFVIFQLADYLITAHALTLFTIRKVHQFDLDVPNKDRLESQYEEIYSNEKRAELIYKFFGDKKMIRTFPNLKIQDVDGNIIFFDTLVDGVIPYYYKFR